MRILLRKFYSYCIWKKDRRIWKISYISQFSVKVKYIGILVWTLFSIIFVSENVLKKIDKPIFLCALLRYNSRMKSRKSFFETCRPSAQTPIPLIAIFNVSVSVSMWILASVCLGQDSPPAAGRPTNAAHLAQGQMTRFFCTAHKVPNKLGQPRASIINKPSNHNNKSLNKFIM